VLVWSAFAPDDFGDGSLAKTQTAIFNPKSGGVEFHEVSVTKHDMFCPGISMLSNGDILVTGGSNAEKTSIFSPAKGKWMPGRDMNVARGYQASTILSNGKVRVQLTYFFVCSAQHMHFWLWATTLKNTWYPRH
jgi:galactose oxidase